ncbi:MAG: hypothetical protein QM756_30970 [Polyangiaceae bacterium]
MRALWGAHGLALLLASASPCYAQSAPPRDMSSWSRLAAQTYVERAQRARTRGDTLAAISAYTEALRIDSTLGGAYLGLAELRVLLGDLGEAESLLSRASALPETRAEALSRRARLYRAQQRDQQALADLQSAVDAEPNAVRLRQLADFYIERRAWVAALCVWRRVAAHPELTPSAREQSELVETLTALTLLAAESDAVQNSTGERSAVRRALARQARLKGRAVAQR